MRNLNPRPRLISILGPGGAGKTRVALQLAAESVDHVKGGVWFVDLSPIEDPATLSQKVIEDLFIKVGIDDPDDAIAAHFRGDPMLVLDNCEHVAREAATFARNLLKSSLAVSIIATSREPLNVAGEHAYRLPAMSVKTEKADHLDDITQQLDSVCLLLERARTRGFEEALRNAKPQTILDLCKKLDGIPLSS